MFLILLFILSREVAFGTVTNMKTVIEKLKFLFKNEVEAEPKTESVKETATTVEETQ